MATTYGQSTLPTIRCSNCNAEIEISAMGDHICGSYPQQYNQGPPQQSYWERNNGPPSGFSNPNVGRNPQNTRPGRMPPSRIDSNAANRPFQRPDNFGQSGPGGRGYDAPYYNPNNDRRPPPPGRSNTSPFDIGPPSPEFSNLDCAFPPFVDSRSATPTLGSPSHPDMENEYVRTHAEPNFYGPRSPRVGNNEGLMQRMNTIAPGPFATAGRQQEQGMQPPSHRRSASMGGKRRSFGLPTRPYDPIERPSTAGPTNQRKQSIGSLSGGPRGFVNAPPVPFAVSQGKPLRPDGAFGFGQADSRMMVSRGMPDPSRQGSPPRQRPLGGNIGFGPAPINDMRGSPERRQPIVGRQPGSQGGFGGFGDGDPVSLDNIPPPSRVDGPYTGATRLDVMSNTGRHNQRPGYPPYGSNQSQRGFEPMPSPTRSQTFPRREDRRSGPSAPLPRRPSEPSPSGRNRAPSTSSRNGPPNSYVPYSAANRDQTPRPPGSGPFPPRAPSRGGMRDDAGPHPPRGQSRNGMRNDTDAGFPARGPSRNGVRGDFGGIDDSQNPYPPRGASRNDMRGRDRAPTNPPPVRGPSRNGGREDLPPNQQSLRNRSGSRTRGPTPYGELPLPILNTATDYDVGDPYHTPTDSASSNASSVSVAQSLASSRSSPPLSEANYQSRRKPSDSSQLDSLLSNMDQLQLKPNVASKTNMSGPDALRRPSIPYNQMPDSPTDPAFQQGYLSPIMSPDLLTLPKQPSSKQKPKPAQPARRATTANKGNCRGCGEKITGKSVSSADGRLTGRYHKDCFVCKTCTEPFATADFYVIKNLPYCAQHYHALNGSLCKTCDRGIEGQYLETEAKQKFHPNCFSCYTCKETLHDDYFELNGKVYCERDANRASARQPPIKDLLGLPSGPGIGRMHPERRTTRLMMMDSNRI